MLLPKFKNQQEYDKAELLMQPIFIRVLDNIRQQSESLNWNVSYEETQEPFPGYIVCLSKDNYEVKKNIWQLCFEICFINYSDSQNEQIETDRIFFDENGELNWQELEAKTQAEVKLLFQQ